MRIVRTLVVLLIFGSTVFGQDTLRITLKQADSLLILRNLTLVASQYDIDAAEAATIQAKLFSNPELSTEWNLYNPAKSRWLDVGSNGQKIISIEKVFQIAGQRNTSIKLAEENKRMTVLQYEALARSLRYELHVAFHRYYFLNHAVNSIDSQLKLLRNLIRVYGEQYEKGNISLQELARLNTTYFNINKQIKDVQQEQIKLQETLKILLAEDRFVLPENPETISNTISNLQLEDLVVRALESRPEIKINESQQQQNHLRYALAKKEAVPDLVAGVVYDQSGSYINNYTALTLGARIPIFNRNQGNIRAARIGIEQGEVLQLAIEERIKKEVESAWRTFQLLWTQYNEVGEDHEEHLNQLSEGLVNNYSKNNISLLEFTDLFEAYNTNIIQFNELKADLIQSYEDLNYAVGEDILN
jgi:cobalt-zinc-cadmium efflux system outer membrane protein